MFVVYLEWLYLCCNVFMLGSARGGCWYQSCVSVPRHRNLRYQMWYQTYVSLHRFDITRAEPHRHTNMQKLCNKWSMVILSWSVSMKSSVSDSSWRHGGQNGFHYTPHSQSVIHSVSLNQQSLSMLTPLSLIGCQQVTHTHIQSGVLYKQSVLCPQFSASWLPVQM